MNEMGDKCFESSEKEPSLEKHSDGGAFNDIDSCMDIVPKRVWQSWNSAALDVLPPLEAPTFENSYFWIFEW